MKKQQFKLFVVFVMAVLISACATSFEPMPDISPVSVKADGYTLKTENAVIVLDASSSMGEGYGQYQKMDIATTTIRNVGCRASQGDTNGPIQSGIIANLSWMFRHTDVEDLHSFMHVGKIGVLADNLHVPGVAFGVISANMYGHIGIAYIEHK